MTLLHCDCDAKLRRAEDEARRERERADDLEQQRERQIEFEDRQREEQRRYTRERMQELMYQAADWPDAFQKQIKLLERERSFCETELQRAKAGHYVDDPAAPTWWQGQVDSLNEQIGRVKVAGQRYAERLAEVDAEYKRRRLEVLNVLAAEVEKEEPSMAEALRADEPSDLLNW